MEKSPADASPKSPERFDERIFLRLKQYFAPYPEFRLILGDTAPEPLRVLTITRRESEVQRQYAIQIERSLFTKAKADWVIPTLLRLIRALAKDGLDASVLRRDDPWIEKLYRAVERPHERETKTRTTATEQAPSVRLSPESIGPIPMISGPALPDKPVDLRHIWNGLLRDYFPGREDLHDYRVVWSQRRQTMTLASCHPLKRIVRVAAVMRHPDALPYLEALVYHELCHAALGPIQRVNGRRVIHGREFKALEKRHPGIPALDVWIANGGWRSLVTNTRRRRGSNR